MFYRRKIILSIFQLFDNKLEKIRLQKLLFLFIQKQQKTTYDFIPYKFGCYSHSANADLSTMVKRGILSEDNESFTKLDEIDYLKQLKPDDINLLQEVHNLFGDMNSSALLKHTYINFPYWATKSEIADNILTKTELEKRTDDFRPESFSPKHYDFSDLTVHNRLDTKSNWFKRKEFCLVNVYTDSKMLQVK